MILKYINYSLQRVYFNNKANLKTIWRMRTMRTKNHEKRSVSLYAHSSSTYTLAHFSVPLSSRDLIASSILLAFNHIHLSFIHLTSPVFKLLHLLHLLNLDFYMPHRSILNPTPRLYSLLYSLLILSSDIPY